MKQATETNNVPLDVNDDIRVERKSFSVSTIQLEVSGQKVESNCDAPGYGDIWALYNTGALFKNGIIIRLIKPGKCSILNIEISLLLVNITTNQYKKYKNSKLAKEEVNGADPKHNLLLFSYHKTDTRSYFTVSGFGPLWEKPEI